MFYVEFTKKLIIFSLFTPRFFIQEFIRVTEIFLRGGEVTQTHVEGGTCQTNKDEQREEGREVKIVSFERKHILNDPQSLVGTTMIYDMLILNLTLI